MAAFTAFYDANVLYPAELRNLLMHLALTGLFRAKWSADVHEGEQVIVRANAAALGLSLENYIRKAILKRIEGSSTPAVIP